MKIKNVNKINIKIKIKIIIVIAVLTIIMNIVKVTSIKIPYMWKMNN